jgi:hypothetical protein
VKTLYPKAILTAPPTTPLGDIVANGPPRSRTHFLFTLSNSTRRSRSRRSRTPPAKPSQARRQAGTSPIVAAGAAAASPSSANRRSLAPLLRTAAARHAGLGPPRWWR